MPDQATLPPPAAPGRVITEPGYHADFPEAAYHDDPVPGGSLSSTGARKLLPPGCPAKYRWWADNREPFKAVFEEGKAAHRKTLGAGPELVLFPGTGANPEAWQRNDDKATVAELRASGKVPLKPSQMAVVDAMATALRTDPLAAPLVDPAHGATELSLFWQHRSVMCRARPDRIVRLRSGRWVIVDYKTAASAAPADVEKAIARYGYHIQGAFYRAGATALGLVPEDAGFLLVVQEKEPPYLATVVEPDFAAMRMGAIRVREALDRYVECVESGWWPGYADDVVLAELPPWETRELEGQVW